MGNGGAGPGGEDVCRKGGHQNRTSANKREGGPNFGHFVRT